jgi:hypothetical protein
MSGKTKIYIYLFCAVIGIGIAFFYVRHAQEKKRDLNSQVTIKFMRNNPQDIITLDIPEGYIDRGIKSFNAGDVNSSLFLRAAGSELQPESMQNQALFSFPKSLYNLVHIQISSAHDLRPDQFDGRTQDFLKFHAEILQRPCSWAQKMTNKYELLQKEVIPASCPQVPLYDLWRRDLYQSRDQNGSLTTVIRCTPMEWKSPDIKKIDGVTPRPMAYCEHEFAIKKLNSWVTLLYPREFLPDWRKMEIKIDEILSNAVEKN